MRQGKQGLLAVLAVCTVLLSAGCASFPADTLKDSKIPSVVAYKNKPRVLLDVKFFQGTPGSGKAVELPSLKPKVLPIVEKVAKESGLFASYTFDEFQQDKVDQTIQLYIYNHAETGASIVFAFLCGFTFGIIPAAATDEYTLVSKVVVAGKPVESSGGRSNDSITTWMGLWFIPMSGKTVDKAFTQTTEELVRDAFAKLVQSKQLRLSLAPRPPLLSAGLQPG